MNPTDRKLARKKLAELLDAVMVGDGKPAQVVFDHLVSDFGGMSPAVVVGSGGSLHDPFVFDGNSAKFRFRVYFYVWYGGSTIPGDQWTEALSEDKLDDMDAVMAIFLQDNPGSATWKAITQVAFSERIDLDIGGNYYISESYVIEVE